MNGTVKDVYYLMALDTLQSGGGTYPRDAFREAHLPNRYTVALGKPLADVVPATLGASAVPAIVKALRALADTRGVWTPERALGTWVDDGKVYIDIVETIANKFTALAVAQQRGELAIWDNVENISIPV